jgi:hypothetical protein
MRQPASRKEALRLVKKAALENHWFPGINSNGENVKILFSTPVTFILK